MGCFDPALSPSLADEAHNGGSEELWRPLVRHGTEERQLDDERPGLMTMAP